MGRRASVSSAMDHLMRVVACFYFPLISCPCLFHSCFPLSLPMPCFSFFFFSILLFFVFLPLDFFPSPRIFPFPEIIFLYISSLLTVHYFTCSLIHHLPVFPMDSLSTFPADYHSISLLTIPLPSSWITSLALKSPRRWRVHLLASSPGFLLSFSLSPHKMYTSSVCVW